MSKKSQLPKIAVTMGDPAGIGPEIILKVFSEENIFNLCNPVIIGDFEFLFRLKKDFLFPLKIKPIKNFKGENSKAGELPIVDLKNINPAEFTRGRPAKQEGRAAIEYIKEGVKLTLAGKIDALVTCPINKKAIHLAGFPYPGHTELLAELTAAKNYAMMLVSKELKVIPLTRHLPLLEVAGLINQREIKRVIRLSSRSLQAFGIKKPRLAVTGLNPHAGDQGVIGKEELTKIIPAIRKIRAEGINVQGPFPADTLFTRGIRKKFDAIITMYHDQALIPLKMLSFGQGVNITLGLPIIRTSVDHGTAYDIAGKNLANPESLREAIKWAVRIKEKENYSPWPIQSQDNFL